MNSKERVEQHTKELRYKVQLSHVALTCKAKVDRTYMTIVINSSRNISIKYSKRTFIGKSVSFIEFYNT